MSKITKEILDLTIPERLYLQSKIISVVDKGIIVTDKYGFIIYANPYISYLFGYTNEELISANTRILKSGKHKDAFYKEMWNKLNKGNTWNGLIKNKAKNGKTFYCKLSIHPVCNSNEEVESFIAIQDRACIKDFLRQWIG